MEDKHSAWLTIGIIAALGGWVSNIIVPERRGVTGFASAALIGVFSGGVAGIAANAFEVQEGWQYLIAGSVAVLGDRILSMVLKSRYEQVSIHNHGNVGQQNISQTGGDASANSTDDH